MSDGALSKLPPPNSEAKKGLNFIKKRASPPKPKLSIVAIKKVAKALEGMGKKVTAVEIQPDGAFQLKIVDQAAAISAGQNEWDELLPS